MLDAVLVLVSWGHRRRWLYLAAGTALTMSACTPGIPNPFAGGSLPALPASAMDLDECQPLTVLPCVDQALQLGVPVVGTRISIVYRSDRVPGRTVPPSADVRGQSLGGWTLDIYHSYQPEQKLLLQGDGQRRRVEAITVDKGKYAGSLAIAATDGTEVFLFDRAGRHQRTLEAFSGATRWRFAHDGAGRLTSVQDQSGNTLTVRRDARDALTGLVLPSGAVAAVTLGAEGYLSQLAQPGLGVAQAGYGRGGLLTTYTAPDRATTHFEYDERGLLTSVVEPGGASRTFTRAAVSGGYSISVASSSGRSATYSATHSGNTITRAVVDGTGTAREEIGTASRQLSLPDGTRFSTQLESDPRFGMQAPIQARVVVVTPRGVRQTLSELRQASTGGDLLLGARVLRRVLVDGRPFSAVYEPANRTLTSTDPTGVAVVRRIDQEGRVEQVTQSGVTTRFTYDQRGRVTAVSSGHADGQRTARAVYDDVAGTVTTTDALGNATTISFDAAGRPAQVALAGAAPLGVLFDPAGRLASIRSPAGRQHVVTYSRRGLVSAELASAEPGDIQGIAFAYDDDRLTSAVMAAAGPPVPLVRDSAGRLTRVETAAALITAEYGDGSVMPSRLSGPGKVNLVRSFDGDRLTGESWSGPVSGEVTYKLDADGRAVGTTTGGFELSAVYDAAGRLKRTGDIAFAYDPGTGLLSQARMGSLTTTVRYDGFSQVVAIETSFGSTNAMSQHVTHDADGRIVQVDEAFGGGTRTVKYGYDAGGRLTSESTDSSVRTYAYDGDGNLTRVLGQDPSLELTYDAADKLLRAGPVVFTYAGDGALNSRQGPEGRTTYVYDQRGVLVSAVLPDGTRVEYLTDALGRRVGKRVNGALVEGYLWAGRRLAAQLDGLGRVVARFVYDSEGRPAELLRDGATYRLLTDDNGSIRLVVDSATGTAVQRIDYDAFGNVLNDTHPGFQPLGFASGLADRDTGLVRFGHRDYDPRARRWTAPDPIGLASGQVNLYAYVDDDPVNLRDPTGLFNPYGPSVVGMYGVTGQGTFVAGGFGGTAGFNLQNIDGHWALYGFYGNGEGLDVGGSVTANIGNLYSPSADPTQDWLGDTESVGGSLGPGTAGYFKSPSLGNTNGDPSYEGLFAGLGVGPFPAGGSVTQTNTVCILGCGGSFGDPHFMTPDGLHFDYQGAGEYQGLISTSRDLEVQVRQEPVLPSPRVAINTAVAVNVAGDRVEVYADDTKLPDRAQLWVNGKPDVGRGSIKLAHGGQLEVDPNLVVITWPDSTVVTIQKSYRLDVSYFLAPSRKGSVRGLWGAFSGDASQDLVTSQGTIVSLPASGHVDVSYADGWRLTQAESLFDDLPGQDVAHYANADWGATPVTPAALDAAARARATAICQNAGFVGPVLADCILDVAATGDPTYAISAAKAAAVQAQVPDRFDIAIGESVNKDRPATGAGIISRAGQKQSYRFYSDAGRTVYVSVDGCQNKPVLELVGPDHAGIAESFGCDSDMGRIRLAEGGQYEILASAFENDTAAFAFTVHPVAADQEYEVKIGASIGRDQPARGAGSIATLGVRQLYTFTVSQPLAVYVEHAGGCDGKAKLLYSLIRRDEVDRPHGRYPVCDDLGRFSLASGNWTVEVVSADRTTGSFGFAVLDVPPDRHFSIAVGSNVSPGEPAAGAGHIDAHGQRQIYDFKASPGQGVQLRHTGGCGQSQQLKYRLAVAGDFDSLYGWLPLCIDQGSITLPGDGPYAVEVQAGTDSGDFGFSLT